MERTPMLLLCQGGEHPRRTSLEDHWNIFGPTLKRLRTQDWKLMILAPSQKHLSHTFPGLAKVKGVLGTKMEFLQVFMEMQCHACKLVSMALNLLKSTQCVGCWELVAAGCKRFVYLELSQITRCRMQLLTHCLNPGKNIMVFNVCLPGYLASTG